MKLRKKRTRRKKKKKRMKNKNTGILISITALSVLFWYLADQWILSPTRLGDVQLWASLLASFVVLVSLMAISFLILNKQIFRGLLVLLVLVPFFLFFEFSFYYLLSSVLMFWFAVYSTKLVKDEAVERTKINIRMILRRGIPPMLTGFFIMISFAYFLSPAVQSIAEREELPPTFNQAVRQVFNVMFKGELEELTPMEREQSETHFVNQVVIEANEVIKPFFGYMPPVIAFGLFLVLQGLSLIFVWLAIAVGIIAFSILKRLNFFRITETQVKSEVLEI
jgi:hypothetical protein